MERHAAQAALSYIRDGMTIGLGSGQAVKYLIEFLSMEDYPNLKIVTNQLSTALAAKKRGLTLVPAALVESLDYTFDTLDYLIEASAGFKVNTTVLCEDKVLAAMAKKAVFMVDESHLIRAVDNSIPVEIEVVRPALSYVGSRLSTMGADVYLEDMHRRQQVKSSAGNFIIEARFTEPQEDLVKLNLGIRSIPGVVETSLFTGLNAAVVIYNREGVRVVDNAVDNMEAVDKETEAK